MWMICCCVKKNNGIGHRRRWKDERQTDRHRKGDKKSIGNLSCIAYVPAFQPFKSGRGAVDDDPVDLPTRIQSLRQLPASCQRMPTENKKTQSWLLMGSSAAIWMHNFTSSGNPIFSSRALLSRQLHQPAIGQADQHTHTHTTLGISVNWISRTDY